MTSARLLERHVWHFEGGLFGGGEVSGGERALQASAGMPSEVTEGETDAEMARRHAEVFLELLKGEGFAKPNPRPMFPNPLGVEHNAHVIESILKYVAPQLGWR